jgi:very-short-patch-repair endonuclease
MGQLSRASGYKHHGFTVIRMQTVYTVTDERGIATPITDTERAERLSRAGFTVTAVSR